MKFVCDMEVHTDGARLQRTSTLYEEEIEIKPSVELIPDEYEHSSNESALVSVFYNALEGDHDEENESTLFANCLSKIGYNISKDHVLNMTSRKQFIETMDKIVESASNKTHLILFVSGFFKWEGTLCFKDNTSIHLNEIWSRFVAAKCPALKDKPKIFVFNAIQHPPQTAVDGILYKEPPHPQAYAVPSEADMLIIYKINNDLEESGDFTESLCSNIESRGKVEDFCNIATFVTTEESDLRPIIISSMTRKFYIIPSPKRGHQLIHQETVIRIEETFKILSEKIHEVCSVLPETKKEKKSILRSFRDLMTPGLERKESKMRKRQAEQNELKNVEKVDEKPPEVSKTDLSLSEEPQASGKRKPSTTKPPVPTKMKDCDSQSNTDLSLARKRSPSISSSKPVTPKPGDPDGRSPTKKEEKKTPWRP